MTRQLNSDGVDQTVLITQRARRGKQLDRHMRCITPDDLKLAYELHWRGVPLNRIARAWQQSGRASYKSPEVASSSMWSLFKARGWQCRDRIDMVRVASTRHGRAGRAQARTYGPDYAAYRRQQRKRNGDLRDVRCAALNAAGEPCRRFALADPHALPRTRPKARLRAPAAPRSGMGRVPSPDAALERPRARHDDVGQCHERCRTPGLGVGAERRWCDGLSVGVSGFVALGGLLAHGFSL